MNIGTSFCPGWMLIRSLVSLTQSSILLRQRTSRSAATHGRLFLSIRGRALLFLPRPMKDVSQISIVFTVFLDLPSDFSLLSSKILGSRKDFLAASMVTVILSQCDWTLPVEPELRIIMNHFIIRMLLAIGTHSLGLLLEHFHFETHSNLLQEDASRFVLLWVLLDRIPQKEWFDFLFHFAVHSLFLMLKLKDSELPLLLLWQLNWFFLQQLLSVKFLGRFLRRARREKTTLTIILFLSRSVRFWLVVRKAFIFIGRATWLVLFQIKSLWSSFLCLCQVLVEPSGHFMGWIYLWKCEPVVNWFLNFRSPCMEWLGLV